jgi:hypothetical protein
VEHVWGRARGGSLVSFFFETRSIGLLVAARCRGFSAIAWTRASAAAIWFFFLIQIDRWYELLQARDAKESDRKRGHAGLSPGSDLHCFFFMFPIGSARCMLSSQEPRKKMTIPGAMQKMTKSKTKMQKRLLDLDSYGLEEKIRKKDDQRLKLKTVQSRLWQKLRTLNFFWLFLDRTENKNELQG